MSLWTMSIDESGSEIREAKIIVKDAWQGQQGSDRDVRRILHASMSSPSAATLPASLEVLA